MACVRLSTKGRFFFLVWFLMRPSACAATAASSPAPSFDEANPSQVRLIGARWHLDSCVKKKGGTRLGWKKCASSLTQKLNASVDLARGLCVVHHCSVCAQVRLCSSGNLAPPSVSLDTAHARTLQMFVFLPSGRKKKRRYFFFFLMCRRNSNT